MIELIVTISLMITGIYICFQEGNIFSFVRVWIANQLDRLVGKKASKYMQKPLWDCLPCMGSLWSILILWKVDLWVLLAVVGLNVIIQTLIPDKEWE